MKQPRDNHLFAALARQYALESILANLPPETTLQARRMVVILIEITPDAFFLQWEKAGLDNTKKSQMLQELLESKAGQVATIYTERYGEIKE
jgi:hypothetical protein